MSKEDSECIHLWIESPDKDERDRGEVCCLKCDRVEPYETVRQRIEMGSWGPSAYCQS